MTTNRNRGERSSDRRPLGRFEVLLVVMATLLFSSGFGHHAHAPLRKPPSLFVLGPSLRFKEICNAYRGTQGSVWGRRHEQKIYDDLFESSDNPFHRNDGDVLVLLLTSESGDQVPAKYEDVLPVPWAKLRARLEKGETFEEAGKARGMKVLALGAPDRTKLAALLLESKPLASLLGSAVVPLPSLFLLGPLSRERFEQIGKAASSGFSVGDDVWGRSHEEKTYDDLFKSKANPFRRRPGDLLVLLLTLARGDQVPEKYGDVLTIPWPKLKKRLEAGEEIEVSGTTRYQEMRVLVLAAPDRARLEALVLASKNLAELVGGPLEPDKSEKPGHHCSEAAASGETLRACRRLAPPAILDG